MSIEVRLKCERSPQDHIKVSSIKHCENVLLEIELNGLEYELYLNIDTSIKLAKSIRTEINKLKGI